MKRTRVFITLVIFLGWIGQLSAHYIWIESAQKAERGIKTEVRIYYGEYNEGVREVKGGRLEEAEGIEAWYVDPKGVRHDLILVKAANYYSAEFVPADSGSYMLCAQNQVREVVDWSKHDIGIVRPVYYATRKLDVNGASQVPPLSAIRPALHIEHIGTDKTQQVFTLYYNGTPLTNAKVFFHAPNEWSKELKTDHQGRVSFTPLWSGMYLVECIYLEKTPGTFRDKDYEAVRHRCTLSIDIK